MTRLLTGLISTLAFTASAFACCGHDDDGAKKATIWKDVTTRETSIITSREGIPLKAQFWGTNTDAAPVAAAPVAAPTPAVVESSNEAPSYRLGFDTNSAKPNSTEQVPEIKKMLKSGEYKSVKIVGFADQRGTLTHNQKLSLERAQEVQKLLKGAAPKKTALNAVGAGVKETPDFEEARVVEIELVR